MHPEVLSASQKRVVRTLAEPLSQEGFYLAGGTALALHLGHRLSVDLDCFKPVLGNVEALIRTLSSGRAAFAVTNVDHETLYIEMDGVQVSFFGYDYPLLTPLVPWPECGIRIAGEDDIACMKLSAVASRGSRKDFVDLHFLIKARRSLKEYLELFQRKFDNRDIGHVIRSLVYFDDAESEPELQMLQPCAWSLLKEDFMLWVKEL